MIYILVKLVKAVCILNLKYKGGEQTVHPLTYFTLRFNWLFAFSGFDFPTRFPEDFFLFCCLALKANGFLLGILSFLFRKNKAFFSYLRLLLLLRKDLATFA